MDLIKQSEYIRKNSCDGCTSSVPGLARLLGIAYRYRLCGPDIGTPVLGTNIVRTSERTRTAYYSGKASLHVEKLRAACLLDVLAEVKPPNEAVN
jgi:hypothetical protein